MVATDSPSTISIIATLVIADKVSISGLSPFIFTMMRVFCNVRIATSASIKLMVLSKCTRLFEEIIVDAFKIDCDGHDFFFTLLPNKQDTRLKVSYLELKFFQQ